MGYSRQQFHEIRRNFQIHGAEGLLDRPPGAKGPHPNRVAPPIEKAILAHALKHPTHGAQRARLYTSKMPVTAVQILNNHVLPFFEKRGVRIRTILSNNGREVLRPEQLM